MRFERLQIVLFRPSSSSSFFLLLRGSLPFLARLVRIGSRVLKTLVPHGIFSSTSLSQKFGTRVFKTIFAIELEF